MNDQLNSEHDFIETASFESDEASQDWQASLPDDLKYIPQNKGWKSPADVLKSYKHLEQYLGAEKAGRGVVLPSDSNDVEAYEHIYDALGRPQDPSGYGLPEHLANQDIDPEFTDSMSQVMHKAGLSTRQARALADAWQGQVQKILEAQEQNYLSELVGVTQTMSTAEIALAKRGCRAMGLSSDQAQAVERALGPKMAVGIFAKLGAHLAEDVRVDQAVSVGNFSSPDSARRRIDQLMGDPQFSQRYLSGDKAAFEEVTALARRACPQV